MWAVKVTADYRHSTATVGGRGFTKSATVIVADVDMTDEIKTSSLLDVKRVRAARKRRAPRTKKAPVAEVVDDGTTKAEA